jgi:flavorubredoxin
VTEITELAPGLLVLTDREPVDGRVSWVPDGATGVEPYNEYLLLAEDRALLVDTGVAKHGPGLVAALEAVLGARQLTVFVSRIELDTLGNLGLVLARFPEARVATANPIAPVDLVHMPQGARWLGGPVTHLRLGGDLAPIGFSSVAVLDPVVRTLGTSWLQERESGVLITSDSFSGELLASMESPVVRRDAMDGLPDVPRLRAAWLAKFHWLAEAEPDGLATHWDRLFAAVTPLAIAPLHGRVQAGETLCAEMLRRYRAAMLGET